MFKIPFLHRKPSGTSRPILGNTWTVAAIVLISTVVTIGMTYVLYTTMQSVFRTNLNERLKSMASVASLNFDPSELDLITGPESVGTPTYEEAVHQLQRIRSLVPNIEYAYILKRTDDPNTMDYIADADSLHPDEKIDLNHDGVINDEDALTYPGDPYDVSPFPEFQKAAFIEPFVDPDFTTSQWGIFLAGTAPIRDLRNPGRSTDYAIGLDLNVTQYANLLRQIILPFIVFVTALLSFIILQAFALRDRWKKQVRQLKETDDAKNETINIVAHQMGTVSTRFRWYAEMLKDGEASKEECAEQVESGNAELRNIADLFLDAAHIYTNKFTVSPKPVELNLFFKRLSDAASLGSSQKKIRYTASISAGLPTALLDEKHTHFSIENLLNNAIKYTPEGGCVDFTVAVNNGILHCSVKDTGVGIPKADKDKMFGQMYRASNVRNKIEGNGLGLYIAKKAIELQDGKIWYESDGIPGKGTTFLIELPLKTATSETETTGEKKPTTK